MVGVVQAVSLAKSMKQHPQKNNSTGLFLHENGSLTNELFAESRPIKLRVEMALRGQKKCNERARKGWVRRKKREHVQSPAKARKWKVERKWK
jgi:hypothetical protein